MKLKIERLHIPQGRRVLAVSDIHGRADWLARLLEEAGFSDGDELFILGDLIEKGPDSLGCLRYCRELHKRENVHILMGNCDTAWTDVLTDEDCSTLRYMLLRPESILNEMCAALGLPVTPESDYPTLRERMREAYGDELSWLASLPHIIETDGYTFVHAGLEPGPLPAQTPWGVMKDDFFWEKCVGEDRRFEKYLVVGHMPTPNYCRFIGSCAPIVDRARKIVNIDGGTIRSSGQLNLVALNGEAPFSCWSTDDLPEIAVARRQEASADPVHLVWSDPFEILRDDEGNPLETDGLALCFSRGRKLLVPVGEILTYPNGELHCGEATDYLLPVNPGDQVKLVFSSPGRSYCKKDGILGWITNDKLAFA